MREIEVTAFGLSPIVTHVITVADATGAAVNADSTPTIEFVDAVGDAVNNATLLDLAVVAQETGVYLVTVNADTLVSAGGLFYQLFGWATVVVDGVTTKIPLEPVRFVPERLFGTVADNGSNTATTFQVASFIGSYAFDMFGSTLDPADILIVFFTGNAIQGEVRKLVSYDNMTAFITVNRAFSSVPSAGDRFLLINR